MTIEDRSFPGTYSDDVLVTNKKANLKMSDYFKALYDQKLDKKTTPNTLYGVDDQGKQVMIDLSEFAVVDEKIEEILDEKDAPANNKQYARQNKKWKEVELYKLKLLDVTIDPTKWIARTGSEDFPFEYHIANNKITANMIPTVIFSEHDALQCNFSPVCESFNGYVSIYARNIPETEFIIPLITLQ